MLAADIAALTGALTVFVEGMLHLETAGIALMVIMAAVQAGVAASVADGISAPAVFASPQALCADASLAAEAVGMGIVIPHHLIKSAVSIVFGHPHAVFVRRNQSCFGLVVGKITKIIVPVHAICIIPGNYRGIKLTVIRIIYPA